MSKTKKAGIIIEVAALFLIGVIAIGLLTYYTNYQLSDTEVKKQTEAFADRIANEVILSIKEYPSYRYLLRYWYEHADTLDPEYDVDYGKGTATEEKCRILTDKYPGIQLKYLSEQEVRDLPDEDEKLYAEIVYSWLTTRFNQIKRSYSLDFVYCVFTGINPSNHPYEKQFFVLSGADEGAERGTVYLQVYPLGVEVSVADQPGLQNAMKAAVNRGISNKKFGLDEDVSIDYLGEAGNYLDYYVYLDTINYNAVLIGMTYNVTDMNANIKAEARRGTLYSVISLIILSILCLQLISLYVLRPLKRVQRNIELYKDTKDSGLVAENLSKNLTGITSFAVKYNELGDLTNDVINLTREMDNYISEIETISAEKERISVELDLASRIQADMLPNIFPPFPDRNEFDLYASMDPAKEVGGDFYDFYLIDDDHLAVVIADVSGKGVPAALFMMAVKIVIYNMIMNEKDPAKALEATNAAICSNNREEMFMTCWLGILDIPTGKLTCANAGHEYPAIKSANGSFELLKDKHGFVIGGMEGIKYTNYEIMLEPGAKVFVYTDGVPEATDNDNQLFGTDRMLEALRYSEDKSIEDVLNTVSEHVSDFIGDALQFDDLTMLCLEYKGTGRSNH